MAELTQNVMDVVESLNLDEDLRQDFYVAWLENEEPAPDFHSEHHVRAFVLAYYNNLKKNRERNEANRARLIQDNKDAILRALGMEGEAEDPGTTLGIQQKLEGILEEMSPLLRATLDRVVLGGETPEELAEDEGMNPNTIYQRVWQIKQQLRGITQ